MPTNALGIFHMLLAFVLFGLGAVVLIRRKSRRARHPLLGTIYFWMLTVVLGTGFIVGVIHHPGEWTVFQVVTPPTWFSGLIGYVVARTRSAPILGRPWLWWHISGTTGSFIGVVSAFTFQIVPRFVPHADPNAVIAALMIVPSIIGSLWAMAVRLCWTGKQIGPALDKRQVIRRHQPVTEGGD